MIDRGAEFISIAVELLRGPRRGAKGASAEIRPSPEGRRVGGSQNMRFTVTKQFVERYL